MPDRTHVQRALRAMKRSADVEFFFGKLTSPQWITPLEEEGLFKEPWAAQSDGTYVGFPFWPQSRYLARVAAQSPEVVMGVIERIPATDNTRVHEDYVDAALAMPPKVAARIVPLAKVWLRGPYQLLLPDKVGDLIRHLASGGETAAARELTAELLTVERDAPRSGTHGRFEDFFYTEILKKDIPTLVAADPRGTLDVLAAALDSALASERTLTEDGPREDYSSIWQPAIEEHEQNNDYDVRPALVAAVRDAAMTVVASGALPLTDVFAALDKRPWKVFTRIGLHLVASFIDRGEELAKSLVFDPSRASDGMLHHEYWRLAQVLFPRLSAPEQETFLDRLEAARAMAEREAESAETPEQQSRQKEVARHRLFRQLTLLQGTLPARGAARFEELAKEFPAVDHPEFLSFSAGTWVGPTSPKSPEDLQALSVDELIRYLHSWEPKAGFMEASPEGLARSLSPAVAAEPDKYASRAMAFAGLDPTYVRAIIEGLRQARKAERPFPWDPVLELCAWVMAQPRVIATRPTKQDEDDADPDWGWTRKEIAGLIEDGVAGPAGALPQQLRSQVWDILAGLAEDPEPSPEHERRYGGENMDPMTLSINSVRGVAMHAVVKYALWVRRHLEAQDDKAPLASGFDAMPEVREVLERHLRLDHDPSLAIRGVYGLWLPWLHLLDPVWTQTHLPEILPRAPEAREQRNAAWGTFLLYSRAFNDTLGLLHDEYSYAIDRLGQEHYPGTRGEDPDAHLVDHLMIYYTRGLVSLEDENDLLARFYRHAPIPLRSKAISGIGHMLHDEQVPAPPAEVQQRLQRLFDARLEASIAWTDKADELASFGWWFASGKLDLQWGLSRLIRIVRDGKTIKAEHLVVKRLAVVSETDPVQAVTALRWIVEADQKGWEIDVWVEDGRAILMRALAHSSQEARDHANRVVNLLVARGNRSYADLLALPGFPSA